MAGNLNDIPSTPAPLNLPQVEPVEYEKNFITTAVCELRFPALLEFETKSPSQLQKELRKEFPNYERRQSVSLGGGDPVKEVKHLFKSKKGDWIVSFRTWAIAIETSRYTSFEEFQGRLTNLLDISRPLLDTDFFTRIGLRYINEIPLEDGNPRGLIREDLVAPLVQGVYGDVTQFSQEIRGFLKTGGYTLRHGLSDIEKGPRTYTLDFDFYEENVQYESVLPLVSDFNKQSFSFFSWAIGPKTLESLGKDIRKPRVR
jgi:uncharacterized protein (TIGR04255 family)